MDGYTYACTRAGLLFFSRGVAPWLLVSQPQGVDTPQLSFFHSSGV